MEDLILGESYTNSPGGGKYRSEWGISDRRLRLIESLVAVISAGFPVESWNFRHEEKGRDILYDTTIKVQLCHSVFNAVWARSAYQCGYICPGGIMKGLQLLLINCLLQNTPMCGRWNHLGLWRCDEPDGGQYILLMQQVVIYVEPSYKRTFDSKWGVFFPQLCVVFYYFFLFEISHLPFLKKVTWWDDPFTFAFLVGRDVEGKEKIEVFALAAWRIKIQVTQKKK